MKRIDRIPTRFDANIGRHLAPRSISAMPVEKTMTWSEYHESTKHSVESLRRAPHLLDWANMPDPFRHYEGVPVLDLPADPPAPEVPALAVLNGVSGTTPAGDGPAFLSQLLFYSAAISASKRVPSTGDRYALRVNPSSGNLHPTEFHFLTRGLNEWPDGLYHYRPSSHMAEQRALGDLNFNLADSDSSAPVVFVAHQHCVARGVEVPRPGISLLPTRHRARLAGARISRASHWMRHLCVRPFSRR